MLDLPIAGDGDDGYDPPMEERVARVEADTHDIKVSIRQLQDTTNVFAQAIIRIETKLDATLPHLATKAELVETRAEIIQTNGRIDETRTTLAAEIERSRSSFTAELAATNARITELRADTVAGFSAIPSKTYMWGILAVLLTAYACGLAGLAVLK